jgi:hypothetical protein
LDPDETKNRDGRQVPILEGDMEDLLLEARRRATTASQTLNGSLIVKERRSRIFEVPGGLPASPPAFPSSIFTTCEELRSGTCAEPGYLR